MKRPIVPVLTVLPLLFVLIADKHASAAEQRGGVSGGRGAAVERGGSFGGHAGAAGRGWSGGGKGMAPSVVIKMQRFNVPRPSNPTHIVNDQRHISWPERDNRGVRIAQQPSRVPPAQHTVVARDHAFVRGITGQQRTEVAHNRFYWHDYKGRRYAHYIDQDGTHWYGFYHGPHFYWTRYYGNRWWWYDPHFLRWVYWWDGFWWWPAANGLTYVYVDNNYYPYDEGGVVVENPEIEPPPSSSPTGEGGSVWNSPDNTRMVQVTGDENEAFLYDKSGGESVFMKYLGQNVDKVRFSGGTNGKSLRILVDFKDGAFALFDANGNPLDAPQVTPDQIPGAPPGSTPPLPSDAEAPAESGQ